jgi:redox-sensitive bicupin YhaK (pirin superfamily)
MNTKEELRQKRKEAYQRAKAKRDADPRYQALKEKIKQDRKNKYRVFKGQQKQAKLEAELKKRAEKDAALMSLLMPASELENKAPEPN